MMVEKNVLDGHQAYFTTSDVLCSLLNDLPEEGCKEFKAEETAEV